MLVLPCNRRFLKSVLLPGMFAGRYALRVVGSTKTGFQLAIERPCKWPNQGSTCYTFGQTYDRQKDAIAYGEQKFHRTVNKPAPFAKAA